MAINKNVIKIEVDASEVNEILNQVEQRIDTLKEKANQLKTTLRECGVSADCDQSQTISLPDE